MDSMVFSRTLLHCQKKLKDGASPDSGVILGWARQFQVDSRSRLKNAYRCLWWSGGMESHVQPFLHWACRIIRVAWHGHERVASNPALGLHG